MIDISRRDRERELKKEIIAEAGLELLANSCYESVTVQDIARKAEFGKGTIYQYFESKEEILAYILERCQEDLYLKMEADCEQSGSAIDSLYIYIKLQYEFYLNYSHLIFSIMRLKLDGSLKEEWFQGVLEKRANKIGVLEKIIAQGRQEGIFMDVDCQKLARVLHNIIRGFSIESLENKEKPAEKDRDLELIGQVLTRGILKLQQEGH